MSVKFNPLADRVLIEAAPTEQKTASGIFIPDTAKEKPLNGIVIAVGSGKKDGFGTAVGKIKILMVDGSYYDGYWKDHKRDGHGIHYYPNGDRYEGSWSDDCRM